MKVEFEITQEDAMQLIEEYRDYIPQELDWSITVNKLFQFLDDMDVESGGIGTLAFILHLCSLDCDVTVKVWDDEDSYVIQINCYGCYFGMDVVIESDRVFLTRGLE